MTDPKTTNQQIPAPVGRLAPSPTGAQHIGNARTYLLAWLSIRTRGGQVIMRIEDIDSPRVKSWAVEQAVEDLDWLGLDWDNASNSPIPMQTERLESYQHYFEKLRQQDLVYPCYCTRSDIEQAASAPHESDPHESDPQRVATQNSSGKNSDLPWARDGVRYPGTCLNRNPAEFNSAESYAWRFKTNGLTKSFTDRFAGRFSAEIEQALGDFVVYKSDGVPAYQLAVVVDDFEMGVTEVLRGDDLIPSTLRQICLFDSFEMPLPEFIHVPLVVGPDGRRLAKRHGDTRLSFLRERGVSPKRLLGLLAHSCGWIPAPEDISVDELKDLYALETIPAKPFVFGPDELQYLLS